MASVPQLFSPEQVTVQSVVQFCSQVIFVADGVIDQVEKVVSSATAVLIKASLVLFSVISE